MLNARVHKVLSGFIAFAMAAAVCCSALLSAQAGQLKPTGKTETVLLTAGGTEKKWLSGQNVHNGQIDYGFDPVDVSEKDFLEFDFYVDNLAALKQEEKFNQCYLRLFSPGTENRDKNFQGLTFEDQLIQNGWNHVKVSFSKLVTSDGGTLDLTQVDGLRFYMEDWGALKPTRDYVFNLKNVYATKNTTAVSTDSVLLTHGEKDTYTWEAGKNPAWGEKKIFFANSQNPVNLSDMEYLEADIYVDDIKYMKTQENFDSFRLRLMTNKGADEGTPGYFTWDISEQVYRNGWNHVKVSLKAPTWQENEPNLTKVTGTQFYFENYTTVTASRNYTLGFANVYAVNVSNNEITEAKALDVYGGNTELKAGDTKNGIVAHTISNLGAGGVDVSAYTNLEFDILITDYEVFKNELKANSIKLKALAKADDKDEESWNYRNVYQVIGDVTHSGWNHVSVPLRGGWYEDSGKAYDKLEAWKQLQFVVENSGDAIALTKDLTIKVRNYTATRVKTQELDGEVLLAEGRASDVGVNGRKIGWDETVLRVNFDTAKDLSGYDYLSLDYILSDYDSVMSAEQFEGICVRLLGDSDGDFLQYGISKMLTGAERSHLVIPLNAMEATIGNINLNSIKGIYVFIGGKGGAQFNIPRSCRAGATNIRVGKFEEVQVDPNEIMIADCESYAGVNPGGNVSNWVDTGKYSQGFASIKALFKKYAEAPGWKNNLRIDLENSIDISKCNVIKFDLWISDAEVYKNEFQPTMYFQVNNNYVGMAKGETGESFLLPKDLKANAWNTITIDISDRTKLDMSLDKIWNVGIKTVHPEASPYSKDHGWNEYDGELTLRLDNVRATIDPDKEIITTYTAPEKSIKLTDGNSVVWSKSQNTELYPKVEYEFENGLDFEGMGTLDMDFYVSDWEAVQNSEGFTGINLHFYPTEDLKDEAAIVIPLNVEGVKDGWNHIQTSLKKVPIETLYQLTITIDDMKNTSALCNIKLSYKNIYAIEAEEGDQPIIPENPDQPSKPDTNAVYISDCEVLENAEIGAWYPSSVRVDDKSKTEGKASISNNLSSAQSLRENSFRYVPASPLDLTGGKELRFDMYVSDPALLAERTDWVVRLSSSSRGTSDYIQWSLADFGTLKEGWNSVSLNIADATAKDGSFDLSSVEAFYMLAQEANFGEDDLVIVKLDNIRVSAAKGTTNQDVTETGVNNMLPIALTGLTIGLGIAFYCGKKRKEEME